MLRQIILIIMITVAVSTMVPANAFAASDDSQWQPLLDVAFEQNSLEMAVLILINDNNVPVSATIKKAGEMGFGYTRIVDALIETKLSCEQVIIEALQNNVSPRAIFNSDKICGDEYGYTPDSILRLLVKKFQFLKEEEEGRGGKNKNLEIKRKNLEIILAVCKSLIDDEGLSQYAVIKNLCDASANSETIYAASKRLNVPMATTLKACPQHAEFGHAYISHELPQEAHIIIGVDHLTINDDAGGGAGQIITPVPPTPVPPTPVPPTPVPPTPVPPTPVPPTPVPPTPVPPTPVPPNPCQCTCNCKCVSLCVPCCPWCKPCCPPISPMRP